MRKFMNQINRYESDYINIHLIMDVYIELLFLLTFRMIQLHSYLIFI